MERAILSWVVLFEGDRWSPIEYVAIATSDEGEFLGIASVSPNKREMHKGPHIVGVWVIPEHRREGIGFALLQACAEHAQKLWGTTLSIVGVSPAGAALIQKAQTCMPILGIMIEGPILP